ncbi:hypothetical protein ID0214_00040 [Helicobacter pylori]
MDSNVKLNSKTLQECAENMSDIVDMVIGAKNKIIQLQQEVNELKRQLCNQNHAKK